ncbi:MAG: hypothetical protein M0R51_16470 [Clostridia bacterium]|jgi:hypothetical protein|nr:hypothetical protein [Clostridia bacterium]
MSFEKITKHDLTRFRKITLRFGNTGYIFNSNDGYNWRATEVLFPTRHTRRANDFYSDSDNKYANEDSILHAINYMIDAKGTFAKLGWIKFYNTQNKRTKTIKLPQF